MPKASVINNFVYEGTLMWLINRKSARAYT